MYWQYVLPARLIDVVPIAVVYMIAYELSAPKYANFVASDLADLDERTELKNPFSFSVYNQQQEAAAPEVAGDEGDAPAKAPEAEASSPAEVVPSLDESALKEAFLKFATEVSIVKVDLLRNQSHERRPDLERNLPAASKTFLMEFFN